MKAAIVCPKCQCAHKETSRFCGACGWELSKPYLRASLSPKGILVTIAVALCLWGSGLALQSMRAGVKPTQEYQPEAISQPIQPDPELDKLRAEAQAHPGDTVFLQKLANALLERMRLVEQPHPALVLEATDVLGQILRTNPKDPNALIALADVSFNQKVFDKAAGLYERYLVLEPSDSSARARYASALAFIGNTTKAISELNTVLKSDPKNFHALAYLSITYAQIGDTEHALEIGKKALAHSPSPEASDRFNEFLVALTAQRKSPVAAQQQTPAQSQTGKEPIEELAGFVASNPVAGPKYVRFETRGDEALALYFRNFPMQAMPPMAKEKFYSGITAKAKALQLRNLKKILFVDADSGAELDALSVQD